MFPKCLLPYKHLNKSIKIKINLPYHRWEERKPNLLVECGEFGDFFEALQKRNACLAVENILVPFTVRVGHPVSL
jgi:hypothetical protein